MSQLKQHIGIALTTTLLIGMLWQTFTVVHFYINQDEIIEAHSSNKEELDLNCKGQDQLKKQLDTSISVQEESKPTRTSKTAILLFV